MFYGPIAKCSALTEQLSDAQVKTLRILNVFSWLGEEQNASTRSLKWHSYINL